MIMKNGILQCFLFLSYLKEVFRTTTTVKKFPFYYCVWQKGGFLDREIALDLLVDKMHGHDFTLQAFSWHNANAKDQKRTMIPCHAIST